MEYRNLGRTGVKVSPLGLGCMMFGGRADEAVSAAIIECALERGINFIDTADVYNQGKSEEIVGRALQKLGGRDRVILATKVHGQTDPGDPNARGNHRRHIIAACEHSLRRLQTDTIDLYQIHRPSSDVPIDETLRALDDLIRAGKVRYVGTSTFAAWQIVDALWAARELGLNRFVAEQPPYHLLDRRVERELLPAAITYGIAILPWSPLAGGVLTGKYAQVESPPPDARYRKQAGGADPHFSAAATAVVDTVRTIAEEKDCTPSQVALAWCAGREGVTCPLVGPRTVEQFEDNVGALDVELGEADHTRLDAVAPPGRASVPYYYADFGPYRYRW